MESVINKKAKYKGIIFDLDGTLANTIEDISDSMNRILSANGFPVHDHNTYKTFVGKGTEHLVTVALPEEFRKKEIISKCLEAMLNDYRDNCLTKTKLYPGISEMFVQLSEYDIKAAVFSNKDQELTEKIVNALIKNYSFDYILGARPELPRKPDPAGAFLICNTLWITPFSEILYVGDSGTDMITANKAGMYAAGVTWGFRTREELVENGAKALLDKPDEIFNLLSDLTHYY